jgi:hypothetical protein
MGIESEAAANIAPMWRNEAPWHHTVAAIGEVISALRFARKEPNGTQLAMFSHLSAHRQRVAPHSKRLTGEDSADFDHEVSG